MDPGQSTAVSRSQQAKLVLTRWLSPLGSRYKQELAKGGPVGHYTTALMLTDLSVTSSRGVSRGVDMESAAKRRNIETPSTRQSIALHGACVYQTKTLAITALVLNSFPRAG